MASPSQHRRTKYVTPLLAPSALRLAVQEGNLLAAEALLAAGGIDVNNPESESAYGGAYGGADTGNSASIDAYLPVLHECVLRNDLDMLRLLLLHGAHVNISSKDNCNFSWTPLHVACNEEMTQIALALLSHKVPTCCPSCCCS